MFMRKTVKDNIYKGDTAGAVPFIALLLVISAPIAGFFVGGTDKEEFLDVVTEEGASTESRIAFIDKGYRPDTACRLEAGKVSKAFLMQSGGEELYISACLKEVELSLKDKAEDDIVSVSPEVQSLNENIEKIDLCAKRAKAHFNPNDPEEYNVFGDAENAFVSKCMLEPNRG